MNVQGECVYIFYEKLKLFFISVNFSDYNDKYLSDQDFIFQKIKNKKNAVNITNLSDEEISFLFKKLNKVIAERIEFKRTHV